MSYSSYLIKNCSATDAEDACPKLWSELKPTFSDLSRHCGHCNKELYLCETDEQIKFYSSVKFCIAILDPEGVAKVVENTPSEHASITTSAEPEKPRGSVIIAIDHYALNVWRRAQPTEHLEEMQHDDIPVFFRRQPEDPEGHEMPAFMRRQKQ